MTAPGEVQVEDRPEPTIVHPTDAIIRLAATCVCGSDLWPYRGVESACRAAARTSCVRREAGAPDGAQPERMRVPLADGTPHRHPGST